jgi:hypothetical protein
VLDIVLGKPFEHTLTRNLCLSDSTVKFTAMPKPFERGGLDLAALHGVVQRPECPGGCGLARRDRTRRARARALSVRDDVQSGPLASARQGCFTVRRLRSYATMGGRRDDLR